MTSSNPAAPSLASLKPGGAKSKFSYPAEMLPNNDRTAKIFKERGGTIGTKRGHRESFERCCSKRRA